MRWIVFDCDSTLSAIEGVDELGAMKGEEVLREVEDLTNKAMDGEVAVEDVFGRRLDLIRPTREEVERVGEMYVEKIVEGVEVMVAELRNRSWEVMILSGGFTPVIRPLAEHLGIGRVEAVDLYFNEDGSYAGYAEDYATTRSGGKPEVIRALRSEGEKPPFSVVMVGDGVSDLETKGEVDLFIGFGGVAEREKVRAGAAEYVWEMSEVVGILDRRFPVL